MVFTTVNPMIKNRSLFRFYDMLDQPTSIKLLDENGVLFFIFIYNIFPAIFSIFENVIIPKYLLK